LEGITESRRCWECGMPEFTEWSCEGGLKPRGSRCRREPCPLSVGYAW